MARLSDVNQRRHDRFISTFSTPIAIIQTTVFAESKNEL